MKSVQKFAVALVGGRQLGRLFPRASTANSLGTCCESHTHGSTGVCRRVEFLGYPELKRTGGSMNKRRVWIAALVSMLIGASALVASGAPGAGRLPWGDNQELLRLQVMGPSVEAPTKEYIIYGTGTVEEQHMLELEELGIEVVSVRGSSAVVRGALTAFSDLSGEGLPWIKNVLPHLAVAHYDYEDFHNDVEMDFVLSACNLQQLQSVEAGEGLLIGVIDTGFTGDLEAQLGADRVHYVTIEGAWYEGAAVARLVEGRDWHWHGTMCAEAIAAIAPEAEFLLFSTPTFLDRPNLLQKIADGSVITIDGRTFNLSEIDVISDSSYYPYPLDHNDGIGELAQLADSIVAAGVPYVEAAGNFASGELTSVAFFSSVFEDTDGNLIHDFDPLADQVNDRNSMSLVLDPWEGDEPAFIQVILEWDGWPYQIRTGTSGAWTAEDIARIQDIDLIVYYEDPETSLLSEVTRSEINQFRSLYDQTGPLTPIFPLEIAEFPTDKPGTYRLVVINYTSAHSSDLEVRPVDFHMYVHTHGTSFALEQHTTAGSLINVGAAKDVLSVGAAAFAKTESWCLTWYSSHGPTDDGRMKPEIVAPTHYLSELLSEPLGFPATGTSASAPVVAGIVALLRGAFPQATPALLREALTHTAQQLPGMCNRAPSPVSCALCGHTCNYGFGCGMVDAWGAYQYLKNALD